MVNLAPLSLRVQFGLALFALAGVCASAPSPEQDPLDASLREAVITLAVPGTGESIVVTSYRPPRSGPFPWIVLSHGTSPSPENNRALGRYRNPQLMHEWLTRGYAVLVPIRRGYGASGGIRQGDAYGSCDRPDFRRAGENAAADLFAVVAHARTQGDMDPQRWMLVGQSSGAFASIYAASKQPEGLQAVLAFAPGRGGNPDMRPGEPCASERLADLFAAITPRITVPVLWFYAENDRYIGPRVQQLWYGRFKAAGGRGELVVIPPFPSNLGHGVFPASAGTPFWTAAVPKFFAAQGLAMPFHR
jgi:dienelactone hydrolase